MSVFSLREFSYAPRNSPIQPRWVPPNCRFEVDDTELEWTYRPVFQRIQRRIVFAEQLISRIPSTLFTSEILRNLLQTGAKY